MVMQILSQCVCVYCEDVKSSGQLWNTQLDIEYHPSSSYLQSNSPSSFWTFLT